MSDAAQLVLFAPYCGGVSREQDLSAALQILGRGALQGRRPVAGSDGHPTHQLVVWLMDCSHLQPSEPDLPNGFWQWLLIERGDAPEQA